jgi:electron transport complex protein RnfC
MVRPSAGHSSSPTAFTASIINAAECEPYITADDRLMQDCAAQVVEGIRILAHVLQPREVLIGIEDNKPQAISMLRAVLAGSHDISLRVVPLPML